MHVRRRAGGGHLLAPRRLCACCTAAGLATHAAATMVVVPPPPRHTAPRWLCRAVACTATPSSPSLTLLMWRWCRTGELGRTAGWACRDTPPQAAGSLGKRAAQAPSDGTGLPGRTGWPLRPWVRLPGSASHLRAAARAAARANGSRTATPAGTAAGASSATGGDGCAHAEAATAGGGQGDVQPAAGRTLRLDQCAPLAKLCHLGRVAADDARRSADLAQRRRSVCCYAAELAACVTQVHCEPVMVWVGGRC